MSPLTDVLASLLLLYVCTIRWRSGTVFYHDTSTKVTASRLLAGLRIVLLMQACNQTTLLCI